MNGRIVFLLEEQSMKALLNEWLPRLFPGWVERQHFLCVQHEGKSDLDKSIPRKLKAWREPDVRFVVVRDNDGADCINLKARLVATCADAGRPETLVRIVCQELESWYIGDLAALANAFEDDKVNSPAMRKRFANPDVWLKPSIELRRMIPTYQKIGGARAIGGHLDVARNVSTSFQNFVKGIQRTAEQMGYQPATT